MLNGGRASGTLHAVSLGPVHAIAIGLVLCAAAWSPAATAQSRGEDPRRSAAAQHFERGVAFAEESRWNDAIRELEAARDLRPTAAVVFNLGMAYRAVGRMREAITAFGVYLDTSTGVPAATRARVEQLVRELLPSLGRLTVSIEPAGAVVAVDGVAVAPGEGGQVVDPGRHTVTASSDGFQTVTRTETFSPGGTTHLELVLIASSRVCRLYVDTSLADSVIRIDGRPAAPGHADEFLEPGVHSVEVTAAGRRTLHREVPLVAGQAVRITMDLGPLPGQSLLHNPWFWGGTGVVVAGIVVGGILIATGVQPVNDLGRPVCIGCPR